MHPIALLTDFGLEDPYVGVMKGVIESLAPGVRTIDITHAVPAQDVLRGALALDAAWTWFPDDTVFLCVVDPGVGTDRRGIVVQVGRRLFVGPDNGLFGLLPGAVAREITAPWGFASRSRTFHGRDLFAPVAARLASGAPWEDVGPVLQGMATLTLPMPVDDAGQVLWTDRYGNCITNLPGRSTGAILVGAHIAPVLSTYGEAAPGALLALTGSTDRLELAVRDGSAARELDIRVGTPVRWRP